jgi:hypothetical protein
MSEYWVSTPNYWCKYCSRYVRDTKLERANHDRTPTHQNALKRELRNLHRNHERGERENERAKAEVERLNNLVGTDKKSSTSTGAFTSAYGSNAKEPQASAADRRQQMEQLAAMGVAISSDLRGDLAMPGDWTVTSTRVINDDERVRAEARAVGVRKREQTEEEKEVEEAVRELERPRKKKKAWGARLMKEEDAELDALLSGDLIKNENPDPDSVKKEGEAAKNEEDSEIKEEHNGDDVKKEDSNPRIEPGKDDSSLVPNLPEDPEASSATATPIFKKRKPKNIRQK